MNKLILFAIICFLVACNKKDNSNPSPTQPVTNFTYISSYANNTEINAANSVYVGLHSQIKISFSEAVKHLSVSDHFLFNEKTGSAVSFNVSFDNHDSSVVLIPAASLQSFSSYSVIVSSGFLSESNKTLNSTITLNFKTGIDSSDKFPIISDNELLDKVQQQTFKYFWDLGHPVSGLALERNTSGDVVTTGGSGFGIMALVACTNRNFIKRAQALARMQKIVGFLKNTAQTFHGAFPHWLNGNTGVVIPFSAKDDGADLVETSYLMQGLLTARQYFNGADSDETNLRNDINTLYNSVEWSWFRKNNENVLYWHWSPKYAWDMNVPIVGWNECLITYVLAASSTTFPIPKIVYDNGWAGNGSIRTNNIVYGLSLPLGPSFGGPLFFSHYSFLGINPNGLTDQYADYQLQTLNHTKINYQYCIANPLNYYGYSNLCWGLTASDVPNGYSANSPTNDIGVISPTAALSSFPYTPVQSMDALKFFYYKLGDKIWKDYGFTDAFSLKDPWFADSYLAIDQGPIIVMIENYRSSLLWNLFTGCPEVKTGMKNLGFTAPYL